MDISVKNNIKLKGKQVTVIGAARSGIAASELLLTLGAKVFLSDNNASTGDNPEVKALQKKGVTIEVGTHSEMIYDTDLMVVSPGVPQNADIIVTAKERGISVIGEVELASWFTELPIVAITGSNGKTTTTAMIAEMCQHSTYTPYLAGNVGIPFSQIVRENLKAEPENGIHILEISSFQMEHIQHFKPQVAVLLNLTPDHLDRYISMEEYATAKMQILKNMTDKDKVIYNADDRFLTSLIHTRARQIPFSLKNHSNSFFTINATKIKDKQGNIIVHLKDLSLPGKHNTANFLAASTVCKILNVPMDSIQKVLTSFRGVPHRIEHICSINEVDYYNDSKATNIESVIVALNSFSRPVILILGGRDKGGDFSKLIPHLTPNVKTILVIGEASDRIIETLGEQFLCMRVTSIESAVKTAYSKAQSDDIVLLSPGCSSFDMFNNYEHRGEMFKQTVIELLESI